METLRFIKRLCESNEIAGELCTSWGTISFEEFFLQSDRFLLRMTCLAEAFQVVKRISKTVKIFGKLGLMRIGIGLMKLPPPLDGTCFQTAGITELLHLMIKYT